MDELAARFRNLPGDTRAALSFFSRLPVRSAPDAFDLTKSAGAWPLAGLFIAIGPAILFVFARAADFPPTVAAILALALMAALTGALHEDGLADTADGFGGGQTREAKLAIMRDSRLGSYGALAIAFAALTKIAALSAIGFRPGHAAIALVGVAVLSRALALWHWRDTPPARNDGMAQAAGQPDATSLALGLATGAVAALALVFAFGVAGVIATLMAAAAVGLFSPFAVRQIGGHSGDTVGAAQQIAEVMLFAGLSIGGPSILI